MKPLPIVDPQAGGPSCVAISGGLSNEQVEIARRMRALKDELGRTPEADRGELQRRWDELVRERDDAWRRKMHSLGHEV